jgi:hypothetical protein
MTTDPKWLAVAAFVGAGAAVLVLKSQDDAARATATPPAATAQPAPAAAPAYVPPPPSPVTPPPAATPVPAPAAAPVREPPLPVPAASSGDPALDGGLARVKLDDRQLAQHARNTYGFDCPEIVDRGAVRSGRYLVTCSNGTRLRVYEEPGLPRITQP